MNKPFIKSGQIGIGVIAVSIILMIVTPQKASKMPEGFMTPIIAFEFIETKVEVDQLFASSIEGEKYDLEMVKGMDMANYVDFLYMVLYSLFLLTISIKIVKETGSKFYYLASFLCLLILFGDLFENIQLLTITSNLSGGGYLEALKYLKVFTWLKWGSLALFFTILSPYFFKGSIFSKIIAIFSVSSSILAVLAFMMRNTFSEIFSLSIMLIFVFFIIYTFIFKKEVEG